MTILLVYCNWEDNDDYWMAVARQMVLLLYIALCALSCRTLSLLLWWEPTPSLRWKVARWGVACTPGGWWKWRTQTTVTLSNWEPCSCEWCLLSASFFFVCVCVCVRAHIHVFTLMWILVFQYLYVWVCAHALACFHQKAYAQCSQYKKGLRKTSVFFSLSTILFETAVGYVSTVYIMSNILCCLSQCWGVLIIIIHVHASYKRTCNQSCMLVGRWALVCWLAA